MSNKANELYTSAVPVSRAYLMAPDTAFNAKKHAINIVVTDELEGQIKSQFGITELNKDTCAGFMPAKDEYPPVLTVKTTEFTKKNEEQYAGPIVDIRGQKMENYFPGKGDTVRVKCWVRNNDGKLSFWLNGIQVVEATREAGGGNGWDDMSSGDEAPAVETPATPTAAADSKNLPF